MYRIAVAALVLAASGCATTGGGGGREGNATIAGVIRLPESGLRADDACGQLQVIVASPDAPTNGLGRTMVKPSRGNRCSFTVSGVPSNTDLQVGLAAGGGLKCETGATPAITPEPSTVKVGDYGTATRDFALSCGA
ncbi:hypothetical protein QEG98_40385 [Myxococcus sp. MxC21-1]|uniref:hypothetical protein n=1 Tax=Myxococcus sp. MxC21-1 TaxID=3041439 RepID=UPI00292E9A6A|nr:hypothetical protein [Myxococcus sp. MxC21-1]WNZ62014.1 hypothetical protein QEG98_40385 [Myxococcus sp. MxC21-1]